MTGPLEHATLSASGSYTWLNCPGSVNAQAKLPDTTSFFAQEGTVAHALGQLCLETGKSPEEFIGAYVAKDEGIDDIAVDEGMANYIQGYVDYVHNLGIHQFIEQQVNFSPWAIEGQFGTSDAIVINDNVMHVVDLKYGKGIVVYAEENPQAKLYALGSYHDFGWMFPSVNTITVHIYQPRINHFDECTIKLKDLLQWGKKVSKPAAEATLDPDAPRIPGDAQCQWCKARSTCKALAEFNMSTAMDDFDSIESPGEVKSAQDMTVSQIATVLHYVDGINKWAQAVEAKGTQLLKDGIDVPGFKLVEGRSNRKFIDKEQSQAWMSQNLGDKAYKPQEFITLAAAEKLVSKPLRDEFNTLWEKPDGQPVIAPESDKRPRFDPKQAASQSAAADFED